MWIRRWRCGTNEIGCRIRPTPLAEERPKDREEYKALWRDTQQQLNELARQVDRFVLEAANRDLAVNARFAELDRTARERDEQTRGRIESLVSAIGELTTLILPPATLQEQIRLIIREELQRAK